MFGWYQRSVKDDEASLVSITNGHVCTATHSFESKLFVQRDIYDSLVMGSSGQRVGAYRFRLVRRPLVVFFMSKVLVRSVALACITPVVAGVVAKLELVVE